MAHVQPGSETGIYFIPLCNLPWSVSWQELKDFVRNLDSAESGKKCDVIHAEVFNGKGYGWVKIRGAEDFWRAYGWLNGRVFAGRQLQADCRNASIPIPLGPNTSFYKELENEQTTSRQRSQLLIAPKITLQNNPSSGSVYRIPYQYQNLSSFMNGAAASPGSMYGTVTPYDKITYQSPVLNAGYPFTGYQYAPQTMPSSLASFDGSPQRSTATNAVQLGATVEVEYRAIHMGQLNPNVDEKDIRRFVVHSVWRGHREIIQQFIRGTHSDSSKRSHAVLVMDTVARAKCAVSVLDGKTFHRQKLRVKIATDGVAIRPRSDQSSTPPFSLTSIPQSYEGNPETQYNTPSSYSSSYRDPPAVVSEFESEFDQADDEDGNDNDDGGSTTPQQCGSTMSTPIPPQYPAIAVSTYVRTSSEPPSPVSSRDDTSDRPRSRKEHRRNESEQPPLSSQRRPRL